MDNLSVFANIPKYSDHKEMLFKHLMRLPDSLFLDRLATVAGARTTEDWLARKAYLLQKYKEILGKFPEKTPLNSQTTGRLEREDYIIEKLIFESRPGFYVTANLYIPKNRDFPVPAVLCPLGHWHKGKAEPEIQARMIGLAKKGYAALTFDPIGQGERLQYFDEEAGKSIVGGAVEEHTMCGNQCFLTGTNLALYMIWDCIRALDYLYELEEVDEMRLACTGASGGGTLTMYLVPLENRISVSVPVAAIGNARRSWESGGISDAEQNLFKSVLYGIDHGDLLSMVAPRPLMIIRESKDYVRLGTRDAYFEAKRIYELMEVEHRIQLVEVNAEHGYNKEMREHMYGWLNQWFDKEEEGSEEPPMEFLSAEELNCTKTGQVATDYKNSETVFSINRAYAEKIAPKFKMPENDEEYFQYRLKVRRWIEGFAGYADVECPLSPEIVGKIEEEDYLIEKIIYQSEPGVNIPGLAFIPKSLVYRFRRNSDSATKTNQPPYPAVLYIHEDGKDAQPEQLRRLVEAGYFVFAIDPRGMGETKPQRTNEFDRRGGYSAQLLGSEAALAYDGLKIGVPLFGMRLLDVIKGVDYLCSRDDVDIDQIGCVGHGVGALLAMYAGSIDGRIEFVVAYEPLISYRSLVKSQFYTHHFNIFLPDVIKAFDLPDVAATIAPRTLILVCPVDAMKNQVPTEVVEKEYAWAKGIYRFLGNEDGLVLKWEVGSGKWEVSDTTDLMKERGEENISKCARLSASLPEVLSPQRGDATATIRGIRKAGMSL